MNVTIDIEMPFPATRVWRLAGGYDLLPAAGFTEDQARQAVQSFANDCARGMARVLRLAAD